MARKIKRVFPEQFKILEDCIRDFIPNGSDKELALLHLKIASVHATSAASQMNDEEESDNLVLNGVNRTPVLIKTEEFGAWLKQRRESLGLSRAEVSGKIGMSAEYIRLLEINERQASPKVKYTLQVVLGTDKPVEEPAS